jgi:hypothetical protein
MCLYAKYLANMTQVSDMAPGPRVKNLLQKKQAKINQTWYILSLGAGNSSLFN